MKEKCPAFKDGCPYSKLTQEVFMDELKKCPEFKSGCPFKDASNVKDVLEELSKMPEAKHHEGSPHEHLLSMLRSVHSVSKSLEGKIGECPVFQTEGGCPFKQASKEGKAVVEPPSTVLEGIATAHDLTEIKEKCPAFKDGCPFATADNEELLKEIKKCPEFTKGCVFKDAKSVEEIQKKLSEIPNQGDEKSCHHRDVLLETMKLIHGAGHSKAGECPVLKDEGCPFSGVKSDGKPVVDPPEAVLPKDADVSALKRKCPASETGCPFSKLAKKE